MNIKASEVLILLGEADEPTPSELDVKYGCDCGCGGNCYNRYEDYLEEENRYLAARLSARKLCEKLGIEYDLN